MGLGHSNFDPPSRQTGSAKKNPSAVAGKGSYCFEAQVGAGAKTVEVKDHRDRRRRTSRWSHVFGDEEELLLAFLLRCFLLGDFLLSHNVASFH